VSGSYLPHLAGSAYADVVAVCDVDMSRAERSAEQHGVAQAFDDVTSMLDGAEFDLFLNTTAMPAHRELNHLALTAGKHVYCEKPIATSYEDGLALVELAETSGLELWGAPNVVLSPQFAYLRELIHGRALGRVCAAHASYGHAGPSWGPWFYGKDGGSLFDLGVYNVTTLTGLLGPAEGVVALSGTAVAEREVDGAMLRAVADDNTMLLIDHGNTVFSHVQTGFVYRAQRGDRSMEFIGTEGAANLLGYDWGPAGVEVWDTASGAWDTRCEDAHGYCWQSGAAYVAECLVKGVEPMMTGAHALHVLEVMTAAKVSAAHGVRMPVESTFELSAPTA
jgi:predicted dehydrogenase